MILYIVMNFLFNIKAPLALQPVFVGKQSLALRKVFFTEIFAVHESLSVTKNSEGTESDGDRSEFGTLNVGNNS